MTLEAVEQPLFAVIIRLYTRIHLVRAVDWMVDYVTRKEISYMVIRQFSHTAKEFSLSCMNAIIGGINIMMECSD